MKASMPVIATSRAKKAIDIESKRIRRLNLYHMTGKPRLAPVVSDLYSISYLFALFLTNAHASSKNAINSNVASVFI